MKKIILLFLFIISIINIQAQSYQHPQNQQPKQINSILKVNPFGIVFGSFNLALEMPVAMHTTVTFRANYFPNLNNNSGLGIEIIPKMYFQPYNRMYYPKGLYANLILAYLNVKTKSYYQKSSNILGFGMGLGYQHITNRGLVLEGGVEGIYFGSEGFFPGLSIGIGGVLKYKQRNIGFPNYEE